MPRTNLSTRPFYNERAVLWGLGLAAVLVVALTAFNITQVLSLTREQGRLSTDIAKDETQAKTLTTQAARVRSTIDQTELERVIAAAHEANAVIDERTFSWTELFNHIERTLPNGVMLTAVTPRVDPKTGVTIALMVLGREVENVDTFIDNLEKTGKFKQMLATSESITEEGLFQVAITGSYLPSAAVPATPGEGETGGSDTNAAEASPASPESAAKPETDAASGQKAPAAPTVKPAPAPAPAPAPRKAASAAEVQP